MREKLRANARVAQVGSVEVLEGSTEAVPQPDATSASNSWSAETEDPCGR